MKRNDRKALEDQIRHMDDVPYNPSPEHIEEIKQRAFQQYMARQFQQTEVPEGQTTKRKGILRRAVIWINDQLHLGITFPEPLNIDPDKAEITESTKFSTLEETVQHVNLPVIYLKDSGDLKLSSISADVILDEKPVLSIIYCNSNDNITILIYAHDSTNAISSSFATNYRIVSSNVGDVFVCESEDGANAYLFYDDYSIRINTSLDLSTFCTVLQSLALFKLS